MVSRNNSCELGQFLQQFRFGIEKQLCPITVFIQIHIEPKPNFAQVWAALPMHKIQTRRDVHWMPKPSILFFWV